MYDMRELLVKPIVNFDSLPLFRYCICLVLEKQHGSRKGQLLCKEAGV